MPLITRTGKGSKLTIPEMDGNLTYLEDLALSSSGPQGITGPTGPFRLPGSIRNDTFTGSIITINHNYGYYPVVQLINSDGELVVPDNLTHSSVNSYTIDFGATVSGTLITGVSDGLRFTGGGTAISFGSSDIHAWGNIIPTSNDNYNLGSSESRWNNLYVKDIFAASQSLYLGTVKLADNDGELVIEKSVDGGTISTISLSVDTKYLEGVSISQNSSLILKSPTTTIYGMNVGAPLPSPNQFFIQVTSENLNGDPTEIAFLISKTDAYGDRTLWWDDTLPPAPQFFVVPIPKHTSKKVSGATPPTSQIIMVPIPKHSSGGGTLKRSSYSTKKLKFTGVSSNDTSKNLSYEYPILSVELLADDSGYVVWCPIAAGGIPQIYQDLNYSFSVLETSEEISKSKLYQRTDSIDWADSGYNDPTGFDYQIDGSSISVSFNFKGATAPWIYDVKSLVKYRDVALTIRDTTNDDNQIDLIVTNVEDDTVSGSGGIVEFTRIDGRITNLPVGASFSFDSNSAIEYKPIETKFIESVSTSQNSSLLVKSPTTTIYDKNVGAPLPSPNQFFIQVTGENLNGDATEIAFLISKTDAIGDRSIWWDDTLPPAPQFFQVPIPKHSSKKVSGATPPTSQIFIVPIPKHSSGGGTLKRSSYSTKKLKFTGVSSNDTSKNLSYEYPILSVELLADESGYVVWCPISAGNVPQIYQDLNYSFSILETSDEISKSKLYSRTDSIDWADSGFNNPTGYDYQIDGSSISVSFNFKGATAPWIYDVKSLVKFRDVALTIRDTTNDDNQIDLIVTNVEDDTVSGSGGIVEFTRIDGRITNLPVGASFSFDSNSTIEYKPIETKFIESVSTSQNSSLLVKSPTTTIYGMTVGAPLPSPNQFFIQVTSENLNGDPTEIAFLISKTDAIGDRSIWWDDTLPPAPQHLQVPIPKMSSKGGTRKRSTYSTKKLKFTGVSSNDTTKNISYEYPILSVELLDSDAGPGVTDAGYVVWCPISAGNVPQIYQDLNYSFSILETSDEISKSKLYSRTDSIDWADSGFNNPTGYDYQIDGSSISVSFNFKGATAPWIYDVKSLIKYRDVALTIRDTDNDDSQIDFIVTNVEDDTVSGSGGIVEFTRIDGIISSLSINGWTFGATSLSFDSNSTIEYKALDPISSALKLSNGFVQSEYPLILGPVTNAGGGPRSFIKLKPKGSKDLSIGVGPITSTASGQTVSMVEVLGDGLISNRFILGDWTDPVTNAGGHRGFIKLKPKGSKDLSIGVGAIGSTSSGETFSAVEVYGDGLVSNTYLFGSWIDSDGDIDTGFGATGSTASGTTFSAVEVFGDGVISNTFFLNNPLDPVTNAGGPRGGLIKLKPKGSKDLRPIGVGPITSTASGQTVSMVDVLGDGIISNTFILGDWTDPVTNSGGLRGGLIKLKPKGSKDLSIGVGPIGSTAGGETFSAVEVYGDGLVSNAYLFGSWIDSDGDIDTGFGATGSTASGTTFSAVEVIGDGIITEKIYFGSVPNQQSLNVQSGKVYVNNSEFKGVQIGYMDFGILAKRNLVTTPVVLGSLTDIPGSPCFLYGGMCELAVSGVTGSTGNAVVRNSNGDVILRADSIDSTGKMRFTPVNGPGFIQTDEVLTLGITGGDFTNYSLNANPSFHYFRIYYISDTLGEII